jgi:uncharacterized membrane protein HdeD (DUF308 family)
LLFGGTVSIVIGIILLAWPDATVGVLAVLLGVNLLLLGALLLVGMLIEHLPVGERILGALLGVLGILAGVAVFARPMQAVGVIVVVTCAFWVAGGIIEFVTGIVTEGANRWVLMLSGAISVFFGIVMISWPEPTVRALVWVIGIWALVSGIIRVYRGWRMSPTAVT